MNATGPDDLLILGIETSCDETAASVVAGGQRVLSNVIASQHELHAEYRGVVPEIASRAHAEKIGPVVRKAVEDAGVTLTDLGAVAVGHRPGLIGSLLVGVSAAKGLAWSLDVPLIGVDHVQAHLYAGCLDRDEPMWPAIGFVVSGGHTSLMICESPLDVRVIGRTIDDAVGEAYDKVASILGVPYPGGPNLDKLARTGNDRVHDFPISRLGPGNLDFSFSGLKTAVLYAVKGIPGRGETGIDADDPGAVADVAASFQRAAVGAATLKLGRAIQAYPECRTLLVGGGVSANSLLRSELAALGEKHGIDVRLPRMDLCLDNAAMLAGLAWHRAARGEHDGLDLRAVPTTGCR